jgi:RHS repeat-associated protein
MQADLTTYKQYATGQYMPFQRFAFEDTGPVTNFGGSWVSGSLGKDSRYVAVETANGYDAYGRITSLTDGRGNSTTFGYGGNPNNAFLTSSNQGGLVTQATYDAEGRVESITDPAGATRSFVYDGFGRLISLKNDVGTVIEFYSYYYSRTSGNNWVFAPWSPNNSRTRSHMVKNPTVQSVSTREYTDGLGRPIQSQVEDGSSWMVQATQYDSMGREWRSWRPYVQTATGYDNSFSTNAKNYYNSLLSTSQAKPYTETLYRPDQLGRPMKVRPPYVGTSWTDEVGYWHGSFPANKWRSVRTTDESGNKTAEYFDLFGNLVRSVLGYGTAEAALTNLTYDVLGQRIETEDPEDVSTTYAFDTRGFLRQRSSPDAGTTQFKYDRNGNLRFTQDADQAAGGRVSFVTYDFADRPLRSGEGTATFSSLDPNGTPSLQTTNGNAEAVYAYDSKPSTGSFPWNLFSTQIGAAAMSDLEGRLAAVASKSGGSWQVTLFSYDRDGQIETRYTYTHATGTTTVATALNTTLEYERNMRGAPTKTTLTVGSQTFRHWYDYTDRGLLWKTYASTGTTKPSTPDVTYTYTADGQLASRRFATHTIVPLTYTIRGQLAQIGNPFSTSYPFSGQYDYFPNGTVQRTTFRNTAVSALTGPIKYEMTYDAINRMTAANYSFYTSSWNATNANDEKNLGYDGSGNLTTLRRYASTGGQVDNLTYNYASGTNRLASVTDAQSPTSQTWDVESGSFTYYADGNLKTAPAPYSITGAWYNARNLPDSVTSAGTKTKYRYDGAGQRIAKKVGSSNAEYYILDGPTTLGVVTLNGSGSPVSWHFNILAGTTPVGRHTNTAARFYYHTDMLGSTRTVVTAAGANAEGYTYYPYSLLNEGLSANFGATKEGFTGKERDAETALSHFGARYYVPALGRWGALDPMADQFAGWSGYNYALNNPAGMVDPDGMSPCSNGAESTSDCIGRLWDAAPEVGAANFGDPVGLCPWCLAAEGGIVLGAEVGSIFPGPGTIVGGVGAVGGIVLGHILFNEQASDDSDSAAGGAKSADEFDRHVGNLADARDRLAGPQERLENAAGPRQRRPLQEQIDRLQQQIKGHEKEIRQKWPLGRPEGE